MATDRAATTDVFEALRREGALSEAAFLRALELSCASPGPQRWRRFLDWLLLGLGASLLLVGLVLVVAFNWAALPGLVKLGLAAALVAAAALGAWRLGLERASGRVALTAAAVLVGPLLALYGQNYQTGADPWMLFAAWVGFIAVWVLVARAPPLWLVQVVLLHVALGLFLEQEISESRWHSGEDFVIQCLVHATAQVLAWAAWEFGAHRHVDWMQGRWLPRLLATGAFGLTFAGATPMLLRLSRQPAEAAMSLGLGAGLVAATMFWFNPRRRDLYLLALSLAWLMATFSTGVGALVFDAHLDLGAFFLMGVLLISEVAAVAWWLRRKHAEWGTP